MTKSILFPRDSVSNDSEIQDFSIINEKFWTVTTSGRRTTVSMHLPLWPCSYVVLPRVSGDPTTCVNRAEGVLQIHYDPITQTIFGGGQAHIRPISISSVNGNLRRYVSAWQRDNNEGQPSSFVQARSLWQNGRSVRNWNLNSLFCSEVAVNPKIREAGRDGFVNGTEVRKRMGNITRTIEVRRKKKQEGVGLKAPSLIFIHSAPIFEANSAKILLSFLPHLVL